MRRVTETKVIYQNDLVTPIGQISLAGYIIKNGGAAFEVRRVLGQYAIVFVLDGGGVYSDTTHPRRPVQTGDMLVLYPELEHSYGPVKQGYWSELFVVFDGPVFDLLRTTGILRPTSPICRLLPIDSWLEKLTSLLSHQEKEDPVTRARNACALVSFLVEATENEWKNQTLLVEHDAIITEARHRLSSNLSSSIDLVDLASDLGIGYETFRKRFRATVGIAPMHYRLTKRLNAACSLLIHTQMTNREIADSLGFTDEMHFSRQFKGEYGLTPKHFRTTKRTGS